LAGVIRAEGASLTGVTVMERSRMKVLPVLSVPSENANLQLAVEVRQLRCIDSEGVLVHRREVAGSGFDVLVPS
jgi:hypothetical protein